MLHKNNKFEIKIYRDGDRTNSLSSTQSGVQRCKFHEPSDRCESNLKPCNNVNVSRFEGDERREEVEQTLRGEDREGGAAGRVERAASARHDALPRGGGPAALRGQPRPARPARAVRLGPLPERALHARLQPRARARRLPEVRRAQVRHLSRAPCHVVACLAVPTFMSVPLAACIAARAIVSLVSACLHRRTGFSHFRLKLEREWMVLVLATCSRNSHLLFAIV